MCKKIHRGGNAEQYNADKKYKEAVAVEMRMNYGRALYADPDATLDDIREAVTTLEDAGQTARRVFGSAHPTYAGIEADLRHARAALGAREAGERVV